MLGSNYPAQPYFAQGPLFNTTTSTSSSTSMSSTSSSTSSTSISTSSTSSSTSTTTIVDDTVKVRTVRKKEFSVADVMPGTPVVY